MDTESIFNEALARPPGERAAFLDQACAGNPALRANVVQLLEAHQQPGEPIEPAMGMRPASVPEEKSGDRIGRYKLLQKIGEGSCGAVWMAEQEEPVRRRVALKIIRLGMDTKAVVARFEAERQALAMMDHPGIAKVFDAGSTDSGRPFFAMELVRGLPITKYCDEKHLPPKERLELFMKVCQAVQHAHQKGIIHRDLKPSNVLVTVNDGEAVPKIIDFGIAKATLGRLTDATVFTAFEQFIGTPAYMSPEQAELTSVDIDTRADIYSLGVMLYELLTGQTPLNSKELVEAGVDRIRQQIREVEPARPSRRLSTLTAAEQTTVARLRGTLAAKLPVLLRGDLDWIVMRCLEKDRARRYDTANGLAQDIQRHLRNEPISARPPSAWYLIQKLARRNRTGAMAVAAVAIAIVVGAGVSISQAVRADAAKQQAVAAEAETSEVNANLRLVRYDEEMNLAGQALEEGNLAKARLLLDRNLPAKGEPDLPGFDWRYLRKQAQSDDVGVLMHDFCGCFTTLAVSPTELIFAAGAAANSLSSNYHVEVRQIPSGALVALIDDPPFGGDLTFSPDGKLLLIGKRPDLGPPGVQKSAIWDTETWEKVRTFEGMGRIRTFSADSQLIIGRVSVPREDRPGRRDYWGAGDRFAVWDVASGEKLRELDGRAILPVRGVPKANLAVSLDGRILFWGGNFRKGIQRWELDSGKELEPLKPPAPFDSAATDLAVSSDGLLAAVHENGAVTLWEIASGQLLHSFREHTGVGSGVDFSADGTRLVSSATDGLIVTYDPKAYAVIGRRANHGDSLRSGVKYSSDGQYLVSGAFDQTVRLWDAIESSADYEHSEYDHLEGYVPIGFSQDGSSLLMARTNGEIVRYELASGKPSELNLKLSTNRPLAAETLAYLANRDLLLFINSEGKVEVWDLQTRSLKNTLELPNDRRAFSMRSTGDASFPVLVASPPTDELPGIQIYILDAQDWAFNEALAGVPGTASRSADGRWLAAWKGPKKGTVIRDTTDDSDRELVPSDSDALFLGGWTAFSPNSSVLAVGTPDSRIHIFDPESGDEDERAPLRGHLGGVMGLAFSPDGKTLASSGEDHLIKLWDTRTWQETLTLPSLPTGKNAFLQFSPDGNSLVAWTPDGDQIQIWQAPSFDQIADMDDSDHLQRDRSAIKQLLDIGD